LWKANATFSIRTGALTRDELSNLKKDELLLEVPVKIVPVVVVPDCELENADFSLIYEKTIILIG
jgi:hypothetical protein